MPGLVQRLDCEAVLMGRILCKLGHHKGQQFLLDVFERLGWLPGYLAAWVCTFVVTRLFAWVCDMAAAVAEAARQPQRDCSLYGDLSLSLSLIGAGHEHRRRQNKYMKINKASPASKGSFCEC